MPLTDDDLKALRLLVREEFQSETHLNALRVLVRDEFQSETRVNALRLLVREEVQAEIQPFRDDVARRFDQVATQIDGLCRRDQKREQEYLFIREQLRRLESRFA